MWAPRLLLVKAVTHRQTGKPEQAARVYSHKSLGWGWGGHGDMQAQCVLLTEETWGFCIYSQGDGTLKLIYDSRFHEGVCNLLQFCQLFPLN